MPLSQITEHERAQLETDLLDWIVAQTGSPRLAFLRVEFSDPSASSGVDQASSNGGSTYTVTATFVMDDATQTASTAYAAVVALLASSSNPSITLGGEPTSAPISNVQATTDAMTTGPTRSPNTPRPSIAPSSCAPTEENETFAPTNTPTTTEPTGGTPTQMPTSVPTARLRIQASRAEDNTDNTALIIGCTIVGIAVLVLIIVLVIRRRHQSRKNATGHDVPTRSSKGFDPEATAELVWHDDPPPEKKALGKKALGKKDARGTSFGVVEGAEVGAVSNPGTTVVVSDYATAADFADGADGENDYVVTSEAAT